MNVPKMLNIKENKKNDLTSDAADLLGYGIRGALIDASSAVHAGVGVDNCDVIHGDGILRAYIGAGSATDTIVNVDFDYHSIYLTAKTGISYKNVFSKHAFFGSVC